MPGREGFRLLISFFISVSLHSGLIVTAGFLGIPEPGLHSGSSFRTAGLFVAIKPIEGDSRPPAPSPDQGRLDAETNQSAGESVGRKGESSMVADHVEAAVVVPDRYYRRTEVDQAPAVIDDIEILAPPTRSERIWSARLRLYISEHGTVDRLDVQNDGVPEHVLEEAIPAFRSARYRPAILNGRAVKGQLVIELTEPR